MRSLLALAALLSLPTFAFAQGSLTPPGAPAPTMKTLTQIEPRTPLQAGSAGVTVNANGGFTIASPGSYYLTGNLTVASGSGITITADNVTLDLSGFSVSSTTDSSGSMSYGITSSGAYCTIRNGAVRGNSYVDSAWTDIGFAYGVKASADSTIENLTVANIRYDAINGGTIRECLVAICAGTGIEGVTVSHSRAIVCKTVGIHGATISECVGESMNETGISGNTVTNSFGRSHWFGISAVQVENSTGIGTVGAGIVCSTALNCTGSTSKGASFGIEADVASGCRGTSTTHVGILAHQAATNCYGITETGDYGLRVVTDRTPGTLGTATNCIGENKGSGAGLSADLAISCKGTSGSGTGLQATSATNCTGKTTGAGLGIDAVTVSGSYGESENNTGLRAEASADNCRGVATGTGYGLYSAGTALNSTGATHSGAYGIFVVGTANTCRGKNNGAGPIDYSLHASIAIGCTSEKGAIEAANRYNMPASP